MRGNLSLFFTTAVLVWPNLGCAAVIAWGGGNIAGDTDVLTNGTLAYAYDWNGVTATVNGVGFAGSSSTGGAGTNVGLTSASGSILNYTAFTNAAVPFSALSSGYQSVLGGGDYANSGAVTLTVTLSNLTVGTVYAVQVWVNDSRVNGLSRATTASSTGGNNVALLHNFLEAAGGVGQYGIGVFTATGATQSFTLTGTSSTQLNALQVRNVTGLGYAPPAPGARANANLSPQAPLLFNYGIQTISGSYNPNPGVISYMPFAGNGSIPSATNYTATWEYQWTNGGGGLPVVSYYLYNTTPNSTVVSGSGYAESNSMADTLAWFATNTTPAAGMPLNYVMSDDEPYAGSSGTLTVVSNGLVQEIALIRQNANTNANLACVGNYACYPGGTDPQMSADARIGNDAMYRGLGLTIALPNAYPYSEYTNNGPTWRSGYFWSDLELVSFVQSNLPAGHLDFPWVDNTLNASAVSPTTADCVALLGQMRLRGANGFNDLGGMVGMIYGWTDWDWLFHGTGSNAVLNLTTSEASGFQWSGYQVGANFGFLFSNLGNSAAAVSLPVFSGLPAASPTVAAGYHWAMDFINAPATIAGSTLWLGRNDINHGLFMNAGGTLTNSIIVSGPGVNPPAAVMIGTDVAGNDSPVFAGPVILNNAVALQNAGTGSVLFSGLISGAFAVTNNGSGSGPVVLSGNNTYSGGTTVAGGILQITSAGALGSGSVSISKSGTNAGTLQLNLPGFNTVANTFSGFNSTTFAGNATVPDIENVAGTNTVTSALTVTGTGGVGVAVQSDAGLLTLAGGISTTLMYRGVELNGAGNGVVSGCITDGPAMPFGLTKDGTGTWTLGGTNGYSGGTAVNAGTLVLVSEQNLTGPITVSNNATLGIMVSGTNQVASSSLTLGGSGGTATNEFWAVAGTAVAPLGTENLVLAGPVTINILGGIFTAGQVYPLIHYTDISGAGGFTLGTVPAGITGTVVTNGGNIALNVTAAAPEIWKGTVSTNWDLGVTTNWSLNGNAAVYGDGGMVQFDDTGTATNVWAVTTVSPGLVTVSNTVKNYFIGGSAIAGAGNLVKLGTGTLTLGGANSYSGSTTVSAGTLTLSSAQAGTGAIAVSDHATLGVAVSGASQVTPSTLTLGSSTGPVTNDFTGVAYSGVAPVSCGSLVLHGPVTVNVLGGTLAAGETYPLIGFGSISGAGGFVLGALPGGVSATLTTNGANIVLNVTAAPYVLWKGSVSTNWDIGLTTNWTFNGVAATYTNGSAVLFNDTASSGTVWVATNVSPAGITVSNNVLSYTISGGPIAGFEGLVKSGPGLLTLSGSNTYSGGTMVNGGTLLMTGPGAPGTGVIVNNSVLTASTLGGPTFNNVISGTGVFTVAGGGTVTLAGTNTYTGGTLIGAGDTLALGGAGQLGGSAAWYAGPITNSGTLRYGSSSAQTLAGVISGAGTLSQNGPGTLTLAGANTYSGVTAVNAGTLQATAPGALPAATVVNFNAATTATLNLQGSAQTVANLVFTNNNVATSIIITGTNGSALNVSPSSLTIAPEASGLNLTVNLGGLTSFTYNNSGGTMAVNGTAALTSGAGGVVALTLAGGTNKIVAGTLGIGDVGGGGGVMTSALVYLGQVNTFDVANLGIGNSGSRSQGTLQFAAGLVNPVLTIAGSSGGSSLAALTLGRHDSYETSDAPVDVMDTTAGTLNAQFGNVIIGQSSPTPDSDGRGITITSSLLMGAGTLTASNLTVGVINNAADTTNYAISITSLFSLTNGGTATITNVTLAANNLSGSANVLTLASTVSLTNGVTLNTAAIGTGAAASAATVTAEVVLGGGTIGNLAGDGLTVSNVSVILAGAATNFLNVSAGRTGTVSSVISGPGALAASGAGTVLLTATNTYSGNTLVNAGTLRLGAAGSIASSAGMVLASNGVFDVSQTGGFALGAGQTLSGNGGVNGSVTAAGGAQLAPGGPATAGTLTFSNALTLNGQPLTFDLSTNLTSGNDLVNVGGVLTLNSNSTVYVTALNGTLVLGTYTLMNYASLAGGKTFVSGASRGVSLVVGATNLTLVVTSTNGGANLTWVGDGKTNSWDVQTSTNWLNAGNPDAFYQGDNVNFTSTGSNTPAINLVTALLPTALAVNAAENYTFSGAGQLAGPVVLNKAGAGTLFLQTSNIYGGGTVISGGTVELDAANAAGTGAISLGTNTLTVNIGAGTLTNVITGAGVINVTETSGDQTTLNAALSAFTGTLNLPASPGGAAKTAFTSSRVNISSNATVTVAGGGTFYLSGVTVAATVKASGPGNSEGYGSVRVDNSTVAGPVMLQTNTWLGAYSGTTGVISGAISDGGNGYGVIVAGPGTLIFSGTNTYTGMTTVTNGTVTVTGNEAAANGGWYIANGNNVTTETVDFNSGSTVTVTNGATFQLGYPAAIGATATLNVAGTVTNGGALNVQRSAVFNLNSGGIWTQSGPMNVGPPGGSGHSTTMSVNSGSTFIYNNNSNSPIVVSPAAANNGACTLNLGGTLVTSQGFTNAVTNSTGSATIVFAGGTLQLAANIAELTSGVNTNNGATFSLGSGGGNINTAGFATAITNVIGGAGGLTKLGGGTLTLGASNTFAGGTTVSGGLLLVNGTAGTGAVTVQTNATLGGSGSLAGAVTVQAGGTLQGGDINYSNTLTFGGGLTLGNSASAATYSSFKIAAGGQVAGGALSVNGTNLINLQDAALPAGTNTLITYSGGAIGGANGFAGFQLGTVPAGVTAQLLNTGSAVELAVTPVPTVNTNPPVLANSLSGGTLTLSWPSNHLGWRLEVQTDAPSAGLGTNWFTWPNSTNVTSTNFTIAPANPTTFFRLVYP